MRLLDTTKTWMTPARSVSPSMIWDDVFSDFDQLMRPLAHRNLGFLPACDISETPDHYLVMFDVPGMKKDDIKIEVQGNELHIAGERTRELSDTAAVGGLRRERTFGKFERAFELPASIDTEKIEAHYESGVLKLALPKAQSTRPRTIEVKSGDEGFFKKILNAARTDQQN